MYVPPYGRNGRVSDSGGAVVPGVEITSRNTSTGAERKTLTNAVGLYSISLLQPGPYEVRVKHPGFRPIVQSGLQLDVDQRQELNFTIEVGAITEQIDVKASVSRLNTVEASQGQVMMDLADALSQMRDQSAGLQDQLDSLREVVYQQDTVIRKLALAAGIPVPPVR